MKEEFMAQIKFINKRILYDKLVPFGFEKIDGGYIYVKELLDGQFVMRVLIKDNSDVETTVTDTSLGTEYVLHLVNSAYGGFVGHMRREYDAVLESIQNNCCEADVFKSDMTKRLIEYVRDTYGDELEFLWEKFTDNAVLRRKDGQKWYAVILTVPKNRLGIKSDEIAEIIDLRAVPEEIENFVDRKEYFPGWHMNKKHWYTVILDGSVEFDEICRRIEESYRLAHK